MTGCAARLAPRACGYHVIRPCGHSRQSSLLLAGRLPCTPARIPPTPCASAARRSPTTSIIRRRWRCSAAAWRSRPTIPATHRALANVLWLNLLFQRGAVTVDHYLGSFSSRTVDLTKPPAEIDAEFRREVGKAIELAEARVSPPAPAIPRPTTISAPPSASRRHTSRRSRDGCSPASAPRGAPTTSTSACSRSIPSAQGRRADRRHLPLRRLDAVAADADDGLRRRLRRRTRTRHPDASSDAAATAVGQPRSTRCSRSSSMYNRERRYDEALEGPAGTAPCCIPVTGWYCWKQARRRSGAGAPARPTTC